MVKYSYSWPINEQTNKTHINNNEDIYKHIDQKYCGRNKCRFLLPVVVGEQESKAQMHFRQLAFLAGKIGRTIVLPNVHHSHMGACLSHPFSFYYDQKRWLKSTKRHFDWITMNDFQTWINERQTVGAQPTGQEIYIEGSQKSGYLYKQKNCFQSLFDFTNRPIVSYQLADISHPLKKDGNITKTMMTLLNDEAREYEYLGKSDGPVDVINLFYDRRFKFINDPIAQVPIPYSSNLVDIANEISSDLKSFTAVHWRMERVQPVSNLVQCAQDLVQRIKKLNTSNVFLLTDYPHTAGAKPESSSFHPNQLRPAHHRAIRYLYEHLNVTLTAVDRSIPYAEKNWNVIPIRTNDTSTIGIIDKLVAMKAQYFFAGKPGVCAKSSSFTGTISFHRHNAIRQGDKDIIVPLETFDLPR
ncbi:hypothetical protein G6F46_012050 [Rhizopus delemar]|nr:hypothetical protein G6F46_012050 [Rhizopus delemar]